MIEKPIEILFLKKAEDFLDEIGEPVRKKFFISMRKTKSRIFGEWFKKLTRVKGLYEFRADHNGKFYRLFSFWDSRDGKQTFIIYTHGLVKKSNKTPMAEIEKAKNLKEKYFKGLI